MTCLDGCVMLTSEGEARDIVPVRGGSHACDTHGRLAVQALVTTDVLIR